MRLDRYLGLCDLGTRKEIKALIKAGRIRVDGALPRGPEDKVEPDAVQATLDGEPLLFRPVAAVLLYKPAGYLSATEDRGGPTVMELLDDALRKRAVFPVGRLDKDTTGVLILTDDGEGGHALLSPKSHVEKAYVAQINRRIGKEHMDAFARGVELSDFTAMPALLEPLPDRDGAHYARVTLHEGKFHQVKRMFAAQGRKVLALHRERFGSLTLDPGMKPGDWRYLTREEWSALRVEAGLPPWPEEV